jgi:hypothetical protein
MATLMLQTPRRRGGYGVAGLGQAPRKPLTEKEIVRSVLDSYVSAATKLAADASEAGNAVSSAVSARAKLVKDVGDLIAKKSNQAAASYLSAGGIGGAFAAAATSAMTSMDGLAHLAKFMKENEVDKTVKESYNQVADVLKHTTAAWTAYKNLRMDFLEAAVFPSGTLDELVGHLNSLFKGSVFTADGIRMQSVINVMGQWANGLGIASEWNARTSEAGTKITSALASLEKTLKPAGVGVGAEARRIPGTAEWNSDLAGLAQTAQKQYLGVLKAEADKGLTDEPGVIEGYFNTAIKFIKGIMPYAGFVFGIVPGVLAYFMLSSGDQFAALSKLAYTGARWTPVVMKGMEAWTTSYSATFKEGRLVKKQTEGAAQEKAVLVADQKSEQVVGAEAAAAREDARRHQNDFLAIKEQFDRVVGAGLALLKDILLYGGLIAGGAIFLIVIVPEIIKKL